MKETVKREWGGRKCAGVLVHITRAQAKSSRLVHVKTSFWNFSPVKLIRAIIFLAACLMRARMWVAGSSTGANLNRRKLLEKNGPVYLISECRIIEIGERLT